MLTLDQAKAHLKLAPAATDEDALLSDYLSAALAVFRVESKRRWPVEGEPALVTITDPPTAQFVRYLDPAVLSDDEQTTALQWLRFYLGHLYENRQPVIVGVNVAQVPATCTALMNLLREPTI